MKTAFDRRKAAILKLLRGAQLLLAFGLVVVVLIGGLVLWTRSVAMLLTGPDPAYGAMLLVVQISVLAVAARVVIPSATPRRSTDQPGPMVRMRRAVHAARSRRVAAR